MTAPSAIARRRRQVAVTQATIARAGRVAQSLGPEWRVEIEGCVVSLVQAVQSTNRSQHVPVAPHENIRL
jgi:hypothetical protein